jgi:hypothetical protein
MPTFETRCVQCGDLKWPVLPARPAAYTCVLCRALPAAKATIRREAAERARQTRKARQGLSEDAP